VQRVACVGLGETRPSKPQGPQSAGRKWLHLCCPRVK
jgi:hypothetical protein